ncbi:MAG: tRNA lysidine(34) synthetase TilS [Gammaproteobacteria bacterium]|nr:tRNA lysidine(34) synthetase TilS [Gammaproteobacteria bacterium]
MGAKQPIDVDWLWQQLQNYSPFKRVVVALSGGVDSTVLLHLMRQLHQLHGLPLSAIHINHQLQTESNGWASHCAELCESWQIPVQIEQVVVEKSGHGLESDARTARYQLFEKQLENGDILLQGHHSDDQAETVLMRLIRGSGVHGLAAIPEERELGLGRVVRPLLTISRQQIVDYAEHHNLNWIEDPSNRDCTIERNLIRHELMPIIERQRGGVKKALVRSAEQLRESAQLLDQLAQLDLQTVQLEPLILDCAALLNHERGRCRNLLRYWIAGNGYLPPASKIIDQIIDEGLNSREDAHPCIDWFGAEVRRYRNRLYLMRRLVADFNHQPLNWDLQNELALPEGLGLLKHERRAGAGIRIELLNEYKVSVRWREGGERIRPQGRVEHHTLKNLFQEAAVPPWLRERYPLIYLGEQLVAIPNLCVAEDFSAKEGDEGAVIQWLPQ